MHFCGGSKCCRSEVRELSLLTLDFYNWVLAAPMNFLVFVESFIIF